MKNLIAILASMFVTITACAQTNVIHEYVWIQYNAVNAQMMIISTDTTQSKVLPVERERSRGWTLRATTRMANAVFSAVQEFEAKGWELVQMEPAMSVAVMRRPRH